MSHSSLKCSLILEAVLFFEFCKKALLFFNQFNRLRGHNWVLFPIGHSTLLPLVQYLRYPKNLKLFSIKRVKEFFKSIVLRGKQNKTKQKRWAFAPNFTYSQF